MTNILSRIIKRGIYISIGKGGTKFFVHITTTRYLIVINNIYILSSVSGIWKAKKSCDKITLTNSERR